MLWNQIDNVFASVTLNFYRGAGGSSVRMPEPQVYGAEPTLPGMDELATALKPIAERLQRITDPASARIGRAVAADGCVLSFW